jgi:ABC-type Fe3+/spermidine/putrescine transport system ATPase subunit
MVFQSYALFPHLTVFENIAFGLKIRKVNRSDIVRRVGKALEAVQLQELETRYPRQLSGGQQQRVALARALVIKPQLLLLDEPLSNLDAKLRQAMRVELLDILREVGTTTILVTHDQEEALALADRVAIMKAGRLEQVGPPGELYDNPRTTFVATFLGESNLFPGVIVEKLGDAALCDIGGGLRVQGSCRSDHPPGSRVQVIVRVEHVQIFSEPPTLPNRFQARLEHVMHLGMNLRYVFRLASYRLVSVDKNRFDRALHSAGNDLYVGWGERETLILPWPDT